MELLNPVRALAASVGEKVVAVVIDGENTEELGSEAIKYGADEVILVEGREYSDYSTDGYTNVLDNLVKNINRAQCLLDRQTGEEIWGRVWPPD